MVKGREWEGKEVMCVCVLFFRKVEFVCLAHLGQASFYYYSVF